MTHKIFSECELWQCMKLIHFSKGFYRAILLLACVRISNVLKQCNFLTSGQNLEPFSSSSIHVAVAASHFYWGTILSSVLLFSIILLFSSLLSSTMARALWIIFKTRERWTSRLRKLLWSLSFFTWKVHPVILCRRRRSLVYIEGSTTADAAVPVGLLALKQMPRRLLLEPSSWDSSSRKCDEAEFSRGERLAT